MRGKLQPLARLGYRWDKKRRIVGVLNVIDGSVSFAHDSKIGVKELGEFYRQIRRQYQTAETIYLIMDNWPIHYHPDVVEAEEENNLRRISLPTYAPWTNPIEKLWRWLYQDILHLHHHADHWWLLIKKVCDFLESFKNGSQELLRYVGLSDGRIPASPPNWRELIRQREQITIQSRGQIRNVSNGGILPI